VELLNSIPVLFRRSLAPKITFLQTELYYNDYVGFENEF